jgi:hypothetical protein
MKASNKIYLKMSVIMLLILAFVLSLLFVMIYFKYQNILSSLNSSKLSVIATSIEQTVSKAGQLGVPLKDMAGMTAVLSRAKKQDEHIKAIEIADAQGKVLFSTDIGNPGTLLNEEWAKTGGSSTIKNWYKDTDDSLVVGLQLIDDLGEFNGNVVLQYNKIDTLELLEETWEHLLTHSLWLFIIFSIVGLLIGRLGFSELIQFYQFLQYLDKNESSSTKLKSSPWMTDFENKIKASNDQYVRLDSELDTLAKAFKSNEGGKKDNG